MKNNSSNNVNRKALAEGLAFLAEGGLNLCGVLDVPTLPEDVAQPLEQAGFHLDDFARLMLLGHGGRRLWAALQEEGLQGPDPIDRYATRLARHFIQEHLAGPSPTVIYPGPLPVPLARLGELAGWCKPSPLGLGIHPTFGLWFAYRVVLLTSLALPLRVEPARPRPCDACPDRPCLAACPAQALDWERGFDVETCARFRLETNSACQERCLARLACPVAVEHRYSDEQLGYHYRHSLGSIRRYYESQ